MMDTVLGDSVDITSFIQDSVHSGQCTVGSHSEQCTMGSHSRQWAVTVHTGQCTMDSAQWTVGRRLWTEGCGGTLWLVALGIARDYDNDEQTNTLSFLSKKSLIGYEGSAQVPHYQSFIFIHSSFILLSHTFLLYHLEKVLRAGKDCFYCTQISP